MGIEVVLHRHGAYVVAHPTGVTCGSPAGEAWLDSRFGPRLASGPGHAARLLEMLEATNGAGDLTNDAHLAALAAEHRASIVSFDSDFSRFPGVRWERPS